MDKKTDVGSKRCKMGNVYDYIRKYGDTLFVDKEFNLIDSVILSNITYFDFEGIVPNDGNKITLNEALKIFLENCDYKDFLNKGFFQKELYKMGKLLIDKNRYKNILLSDYVYDLSHDKQFCAMKMLLPDGTIYICFEGTDHNVVGWEEDFALSYKYPVPAQVDAINYLNRVIKFFDKKVIVGGHSKGGNLALVSAMNAKFYIKLKIKAIYNFDGPGLRKREINSFKFKLIKRKLVHVIPNYSIIGLLLRHESNYKVIKSSRMDFMAHCIFTWKVEKDRFEETELSTLSKRLDSSITLWLEEHSDEERELVSTGLFGILKELQIDNFMETTKFRNLLAIIKTSKKMDQSTKNMLVDFVKFNVSYCLMKNESEDKT